MDSLASAMGSVGSGLKSVFTGGGAPTNGTTPGTFPGAGGPPTGGGLLSNPLSLLQLGSGIFGTIGNIQANKARNDVLSQEMAQMNALNKMTPAQVAAGIQSLQVPLSKDLTNSVGNTVQGEMAERGLSQAPGIYSTVLAQALAPYQLQQQQMAQQAFFQKLGLPISARPSPFGPFPETTNTSPIWQALFNKQYGNYNNYANNGGVNPAFSGMMANSAMGAADIMPLSPGTMGVDAPIDPSSAYSLGAAA